MRSGKWEVGSGKWEVGSEKWEVGRSEEWETLSNAVYEDFNQSSG